MIIRKPSHQPKLKQIFFLSFLVRNNSENPFILYSSFMFKDFALILNSFTDIVLLILLRKLDCYRVVALVIILSGFIES